MEIYDSRYFAVNKAFMMGFGLWPYQNARSKFYIRIVSSLALSTMLLPQLLSMYQHFGLIDKVIEHLAILLFVSAMFLKLLTSIFAEDKLKTVCDNIINNWQKITDKDEKKILIEYSERGRTLTLGYIAYVSAALISFITLPVTPIVLNLLKPLNDSREKLFILNGEFMVDSHAHYGKIYLFDCLVSSVTAFIIIAVDTMYAACIEHCLGLFGIVNFANVLESSYSMSFFFLMGINMFVFSITSVLVIIKLDQIMEFIRFSMILVGMMVHLFYVSWPGQKIIDHSSSIFRDLYTNEWYEISIRAQKLLNFITLRCLKPCQLTAGGLYVMNFANFLSIMKTSISYITVFSSFR